MDENLRSWFRRMGADSTSSKSLMNHYNESLISDDDALKLVAKTGLEMLAKFEAQVTKWR